MKKYVVKIFVAFCCGANITRFFKQFELPFAPFYGLELKESGNPTIHVADYETSLTNQITTISYDVDDDLFEISIMNGSSEMCPNVQKKTNRDTKKL